MIPTVTNVTERNSIDNRNQIRKVIVLTYYVGTLGPFTLVTNQLDIQSGAAQLAMQNFANTLAGLPGLTVQGA
jgi:hypothetical protein